MADSSKVMPSWVIEHVKDESALQFVRAVYAIIELWDDLIDRDQEPTAAEINRVFFLALITLPGNQFYRNNYGALSAVVLSSILSWHTANAVAGSVEAKAHAYALRKEFINLVVVCVALTSGVDAAQNASLVGWNAATKDDPFEKFMKEKE